MSREFVLHQCIRPGKFTFFRQLIPRATQYEYYFNRKKIIKQEQNDPF
jgi:hypothetical protein